MNIVFISCSYSLHTLIAQQNFCFSLIFVFLASESSTTMNEEHGYGCDQCDRSFKSAQALCAHKKFHMKKEKAHMKRETQCTQCGKVFPSQEAMAGHIRSHKRIIFVPRAQVVQQPQPCLPCIECEMTFLLVKDREEHINNVHREERRCRHSKIDLNALPREQRFPSE